MTPATKRPAKRPAKRPKVRVKIEVVRTAPTPECRQAWSKFIESVAARVLAQS
jgi:hypothetical protein